MSLKSEALDALVRLAVDATCQQLGIHGACPIAQTLVEAAIREAQEPSEKRGVPVGDREARKVRPEEKRDKRTELVPEERVFQLPDIIPPLTFAPFVRRAIIRGMASHVAGTAMGRPVGAGGRVVQSIADRVIAGGGMRRENNVPGDPGGGPSATGE